MQYDAIKSYGIYIGVDHRQLAIYYHPFEINLIVVENNFQLILRWP